MTERNAARTPPKGAPALHGTRVLDTAWSGAGMFCATLLGDLGADVIKVHDPYPDMPGPETGQPLPDVPALLGLRNCRTIGIDPAHEDGRQVFLDLVRAADVVVEAAGPEGGERPGIDYATLAAVNPRIVHAALSGYGRDGPCRDTAGHDLNFISAGGLLGMTGATGGPPVMPGTLVAELAAGGMGAVIGILAALMAREETGKGQFVDVSLTDGIVEMMAVWLNPYLVWGALSRRGDAWLTGHWPWYNVYETRDGGHVSVGALEPWFYANLCRLIGSDDFIDHQYAEEPKRDEIFRRFRETFLTRTRDEWVETLRQQDTCVAPVYSLEELASDPQLTARGIIQDLEHPLLGRIKQVGSMFKLSDSPFQVTEWSVRFGQHTDRILADIGYDAARIDALRRARAIQ